MGDFNARILRLDGTIKENIGEHFLKTEKPIEEINKDVWDNRERFVNFIQDNELVVMSTMFKKNKKNYSLTET
eukprot:2870184-Karenia_brevis.AAC.1